MPTSTGLRVALCFGTFPPDRNGGADFLAHFSAALAAAGADVHVLTSVNDAPEHEAFSDSVTAHRIVHDWRLLHGRESLRRLNAVIDSERIDVLHVLFPDSEVHDAYQLVAVAGFRRVPLVTTFWSLGLGRRSPLAIRLTSLALLARSAALSSHDPGYLTA